MAELKTKPTEQKVKDFLNAIKHEQTRADCIELDILMSQIVKQPGKMWGPSIVGYGDMHYVYDSGREGDWFLMGFSPRKQNLTIYIMSGYTHHPELMQTLGKYKTGKSCLYVKKLNDLHIPTLKKLMKAGLAKTKADMKMFEAKRKQAKKSVR